MFSETENSFDFGKQYAYIPVLTKPSPSEPRPTIWALLQLEQSLYAPLGCLLIGSQLNSTTTDSSCRIAFYAKVIQVVTDEKNNLSSLHVFKPKLRTAKVDRVVSEYEVIGTSLLEKGGSIQPFVGLKVVTKDGIEGVIDSPFGKAGKFKVSFHQEHHLEKNDELSLHFRRYLFDKEKKIHQN